MSRQLHRIDPIEALESRRLLAVHLPDVGALIARLAPEVGLHKTKASAAPSVLADAASTGGGNSAPGSLTNAPLAGRIVYTSGGHGFVWRDSSSSWGVMRGYLNNMMEDLGNQDQLEPFANYLLQAGATVVSMRPVGHQVNEVIVDNASVYSAANGGYQVISGSWTNKTDGPYWSNAVDGNDAVHYVTAATSLTETAVARFTPKIAAAGFYPVYAWWNPGTNGSSNDRVADQTFRINYAGGSREVKVAANKTGKGWVYLGDYYFDAGVNGTSGSVEVSNKSATTGKVVVADAIRFGNGMGDVNYSYTYSGGVATKKTFAVSGQPREDECALYWCYAMRGWTSPNNPVAPSVVYSGSTVDDETKNFSACDKYAAYMNQGGVGSNRDRVWISFHSNAGGGRGTVGLITSNPTTNQEELALIAGRTVQNVMQGLNATHEYAWSMDTTPTFTGGYSEISAGTIGTEFDATIIEVAFHDDATDAALLKDPGVRNDVGKAAYQTAVQYFKAFGSLAQTTYLPEPPVNVRAQADASGNVTVSWGAGPSSPVLAGYDPLGTDNVNSTADNPGPWGQAATSYKVYTSVNGYGFDGGITVTGDTSLTFSGLSKTQPTYFKVTALNAGGESLGSYVVVAKPQASGKSPVLVVNGFTRVDDDGDQVDTKYFGTAQRARYRYNNTYDYVVPVASSIKAYDSALGVDSAPASAVSAGLVNLSDYAAVIWLGGEEADVWTNTTPAKTHRFQSFDTATQAAITNYLAGGGKMFVSGANLAWDLASSGGNHGAAFLSDTLHTTYLRDDNNTYNFAGGVSGSAFANVPAGSFDNGTHGSYDVDKPDGISAGAGAKVALNYSGGSGGAAAIQYSSGNTRLIVMGFPLESVYTQTTRDALVKGALDFFELGVPRSTSPGAPVLALGFDTGVSASDGVTRINAGLQVVVPGTVAGATVRLYDGAGVIGTGTGNGGSITINVGTTLADGAHALVATQADGALAESFSSAALALTIDTVAPVATLAAVSSPRSTPVGGEAVTFSEPVTGMGTGVWTLSRYTDANVLTVAQPVTGNGSSYTLTNLTSVTTRAGVYVLSLTRDGVTDVAGNPVAGVAAVTWANNRATGTTGADQIAVTSNAADPAGALDITLNGVTYAVGLAGLGTLIVAAGGGDAVTIGAPAAAPTFDAGAGLKLEMDPLTSELVVVGGAGDDLMSVSATSLVLNGWSVGFTAGGSPPVVGLAGTWGGNDTLTVLSKAVDLVTDVGGGLTLNLRTGASAIIDASQHLAGLSITAGANATMTPGADKVLVVGSLTMSGSAWLDLADNDMVVLAGGFDPRPLLASGWNGGTWNGPGIRSSAAANDSVAGLGYALADDALMGTFRGEVVPGTATLIKYTYLGDTDLDGRVTFDDLARVDRGRAKGLSGWIAGDSDYDGDVDDADVISAWTALGMG